MNRAGLSAALLVMGAGWGLTQPLSKIAVDGGLQPFGLVFWQLVLSGVLLGAICALRGRLRFERRHFGLFLFIALVGTVLPNAASYKAYQELSSGVMSVLIATVPMFALPIALWMGLDGFRPGRLIGLLAGLVGVALLVLPGQGEASTGPVWAYALALMAPALYAVEGNVIAKRGLSGLDPVQALFGASVLGAVIALPLAVGSGQWISLAQPMGQAHWAMVGASLIHGAVYASYVWMVGRAGPVFAGLVAYLVTGFGVIWAVLLLGEGYSPWFWVAIVLILGGVFLVQPRSKAQA